MAFLKPHDPQRLDNPALPLGSAVPLQAKGSIGDSKPPLPNITPSWTKPVTRAIAFAEAQSARVIGLTAVNANANATSIAQAFAKLYSEFGKNILFVSAAGLIVSDRAASDVDVLPGIKRYSLTLAYLDLCRQGPTLPKKTSFHQQWLHTAMNEFDAIVIDLPNALAPSGEPVPGFLSAAPACDTVLLVCQTGRTTRADLRQAIAACRIAGAAVSGVVLNDEQLPASWLLTDG